MYQFQNKQVKRLPSKEYLNSVLNTERFIKIEIYIRVYSKLTPSPLRGTPSINRGRVEILPVFGKNHQHLLYL